MKHISFIKNVKMQTGIYILSVLYCYEIVIFLLAVSVCKMKYDYKSHTGVWDLGALFHLEGCFIT